MILLHPVTLTAERSYYFFQDFPLSIYGCKNGPICMTYYNWISKIKTHYNMKRHKNLVTHLSSNFTSYK